jgi:FtsZ-binding cell division protein ZapB
MLSSDVQAGEPSIRQQSVEAIEQLQQEIKSKFSIGSAEALREAQELREDIERREEQLKALTNRES